MFASLSIPRHALCDDEGVVATGSHTLGSWTCDTPAGEPDETMTCNFPMTDVALVIPFYWEEVPILERTLKGWTHPDSFPCTPNEESANHVDLILLLTVPSLSLTLSLCQEKKKR